MSFSQYESDDVGLRPARLPWAGNTLVRAASTTLWAAVNVGLVFVEQIAELLAPLMLLAGAAWWALPRALSAIVLDGPANDLLRGVTARVPTEILVEGTWLSPAKLISDAVLLFLLVAVCRTMGALMTRALFGER